MNTRNLKHGYAGRSNPEYRAWSAMRSRCLTESHKFYRHYGGRGIRVCPEWSEFPAFLADVGLRPHAGLSLDRIDNDGNYEPGNVRWATSDQQRRNTQRTVMLSISGERRCLSEWIGVLKVSRKSVIKMVIADREFRSVGAA